VDGSETCTTRSSAMPVCRTKLIPCNRRAQFMTMKAESGLLIDVKSSSCQHCVVHGRVSERRLAHSSVRMRIIVARTVTCPMRLKTVPQPPDEKKQDETCQNCSNRRVRYGWIRGWTKHIAGRAAVARRSVSSRSVMWKWL